MSEFSWRNLGEKPYRFRFSPEYDAGTPFWLGGAVPVEDLPLSPELTAAIRRWNDYFETHFHWETGWRDAEGGRLFNVEARVLCDRAQSELGEDYVLTFDLWT